MSELNFEIQGAKAEVSARIFREAIGHAVSLLNEFDSALSGKRYGTLSWYVNDLYSNGSLRVGFVSRTKPQARTKLIDRTPDLSPSVTQNFLTGLEDLEEKCITPPYLSEFGLQRASDLASLIRKDGPKAFRFEAQNRSIQVTPRTVENVGKLLPIRRTALGSVEGRLVGINVHRNFRGLIYHAITNKAITCIFDNDKLDKVKDALGKRVIASGTLQKNLNGDTIRILLRDLDVVEDKSRFVLPDVGELGKPDFEESISTVEYLRRIRGAR